MKDDFDSVLNQCLDMMARGVDVEACLQSFAQHAERLRPLLATAARARPVQVPEPSPQALAVGQQALLAAVARRRMEQESRGRRWGLGRPLAMLGSALALAALAVAGLYLGGPLRDAFDLGETAVADGTVTSVAGGSLVIEKPDGALASVVFDDETEIELEDGSPVDITVVTPGTEIRIRGRQEGEGAIVAQRIEVRIEAEAPGQGLPELEFEGQVVTMSNGTLTVSTLAGNVVVQVTLGTEVDGQLQEGVIIRVHGTQEADGTVTAREVDVMSGGGSSGSGDD